MWAQRQAVRGSNVWWVKVSSKSYRPVVSNTSDSYLLAPTAPWEQNLDKGGEAPQPARMAARGATMSRSSPRVRYRREFLRFVAASPLLAYGLREAWAREPDGPARQGGAERHGLRGARQAEAAPAHWGYMASGSDDNLTLQANVAAYKNIQLRPRRLVDVSKIDAGVELFGQRFASPISCAGGWPSHVPHRRRGGDRARRQGEERAASAVHQTSIGVEEVAAARGWRAVVPASTCRRRGKTPRSSCEGSRRRAVPCWCGPSTSSAAEH